MVRNQALPPTDKERQDSTQTKKRLYWLNKTQRTVKTCTGIAQTVSVFYCVDLFTSYLKLSLMTIHYISNI